MSLQHELIFRRNFTVRLLKKHLVTEAKSRHNEGMYFGAVVRSRVRTPVARIRRYSLRVFWKEFAAWIATYQ